VVRDAVEQAVIKVHQTFILSSGHPEHSHYNSEGLPPEYMRWAPRDENGHTERFFRCAHQERVGRTVHAVYVEFECPTDLELYRA